MPSTNTQYSHSDIEKQDALSIEMASSGRSSPHEAYPMTELTVIPPQGDIPVELNSSSDLIPDEIYDQISPARKLVILILISFCAFLAPVSSTTVLAAVPEVAADFSTTGAIINLSNALYMIFMGISALVWSPLSQVYGRRPVSLKTFFLAIHKSAT
jgi:hypothetical protein